MNVWYCADLHVGDPRGLWIGRGYNSLSHHDAHVREMWESQVQLEDEVWVLGDVAFNYVTGLSWIRDLPGEKHLVVGNFERCHPMFRDAHKWQREYFKFFESVQSIARHRINGQSILLSHYPYTWNPQGPRRSNQWRPRDEGLWLLHGHEHSKEIRTAPRQIHVGWDAWKRLVRRDEIASILVDNCHTVRDNVTTSHSHG